MRVLKENELKDYKPKFEPVHIILESQEEVDLLYGIFSYTPLLDCFRCTLNNLVTRLYKRLSQVGTRGYEWYYDQVNFNLKHR